MSPKTNDHDNSRNDPRRCFPKGREDGSRPQEMGSSTKPLLSFPSLPVSISGWEAPQGVVYGTGSPSNDGVPRKDYTSNSSTNSNSSNSSNKRSGVITMMKPREKLLKGLLRRPDAPISI